MDIIRKLQAQLKRRLRVIPIRYALLFTLINTFFLFYMPGFFVRVLMFLVSAAVLYRFGRLPFLDADPVPFTAGVLLFWFDLPIAFQYIVWTIPAADVIAARLNQWSIVNFFALSVALAVSALVKPWVSFYILLYVVIMVFNLVRFVLTILMGAGLNGLLSQITHTLFYVFVINLFGGLIILFDNFF